MDTSAEKRRDVDVTVTIKDIENDNKLVKAYEVKHESKPLDITTIEQLCAKLGDMPSLSYRAIVSSSGYTAGARSKATSKGVELFTLRPWVELSRDLFPSFPQKGEKHEFFEFKKYLLTWREFNIHLDAPSTTGRFYVANQDELFASDGSRHEKYGTFNEYSTELLLRSTERLFDKEPAISKRRTVFRTHGSDTQAEPEETWSHTHTFDVHDDHIYLGVNDGLHRLAAVTISGALAWNLSTSTPDYFVIQSESDGFPLAGAMVSLGERDGQMFCMTVTPNSRDVGIEFVRLHESHLRAIRNLRLLDARR